MRDSPAGSREPGGGQQNVYPAGAMVQKACGAPRTGIRDPEIWMALPPTAPARFGAAGVCFPSGCRLRLGLALDLEDLDLEDKDRAGRDVLPALPVAVREL